VSRARRSPEELFAAAREGDRSALARLLSVIERGGPDARAVGRLTHPLSGGSYMIGLTGAPGAGKSTLTSATITHLRRLELEVAVLAIDPSSPFTGGAILGDRIRMHEHATDEGVVIRSMATRGHLGGLALATPAAVRVLDAAGWPWVLVETVGVGQVEVEVAGAADTTVVVLNPGWGDAVQASKAGLLEIADIFVVNKADRPGAAEARDDLERVLDLSSPDRRPEVLTTVAETGDGVAELWAAIGRHRGDLESSGDLERRREERVGDELAALVAERILEQARHAAGGTTFDKLVQAVRERRIDPWTATDALLDDADGAGR
jgi:LAO/AO transport system kinase